MILLPLILLATPVSLAPQSSDQANPLPQGPEALDTELDYQDLLDRSLNLHWQTSPVLPGERTALFSSKDPASNGGPKADGWFSIQDQGHFLSSFERAGHTEYLMVEAQGPGQIARIRMHEPKGILRFYVDGAGEPSFEIEAANFFGPGGPFQPPMIRADRFASTCWVPLPFAQSIRMTTTQKTARYEVSVQHFPAAYTVPSLSVDLISEHVEKIKQLGTKIAKNEDPFVKRKPVFMTGSVNKSTKFKFDIKGNGILRWMTVSFISKDKLQPNDMEEYMRSLRLQITEGEMFSDSRFILVDVPFGDFFGTAPGLNTFRANALSVDALGQRFTCRFPMPYVDGLGIHISSEHQLAKTVFLKIDAGFDQMLNPPQSRFRASFFQKRGMATRPVRDETLALLKGPGRLVGTTLTVLNPSLEDWGAGGVKLWVDGESFPSWFGTGSADYFDRMTRNDGPEHYGYTSLNRLHTNDAVPFQKDLRFDLELNHSLDTEINWEGVLYWYGPAKTDLPFQMASADNLVVAPLPRANFDYVPGVLECEILTVQKLDSKGELMVMEQWPGADPSSGKFLALTGASAEDYLKLEFPVSRRGDWDISLRVLTWPGGPKVQAYFNGQTIAGPFSLDSGDEPMQWQRVDLGHMPLSGRDHILTLSLESDSNGPDGLNLALDYLQLLPREKQ
jgi:D-arabinan exo alpha-(1,3)/(1,5)-arabinofuranosidase (non-reducing end)